MKQSDASVFQKHKESDLQKLCTHTSWICDCYSTCKMVYVWRFHQFCTNVYCVCTFYISNSISRNCVLKEVIQYD